MSFFKETITMEQQPTLKFNTNTYRRLNIQHKMDEASLKKDHLLNLQFYKYREDMFHQKIDRLKKSLEDIHPYIDDQQTLITPNCSARVKTQFRILNFSSQTQKRLLCQPPISNKSSKQISHPPPPIPYRINECLKPIPFYQTRLPTIYSCRSNSNEEKYSQVFLNQQILNEYKNQLKYKERKAILLKQFDELKHTIDDPNATLSALAALSRALHYLDSGIK